MKKILLASAALFALAAPASAADLAARTYTKAPAMAASPIYNWTGFYIGGHVGGAFRGESNTLIGGGNDGTFAGGAQVGYDTQFAPNWVAGLEANYTWLDTGSNTFANRGLGSVTGRLGYTWGPSLLYVKGGYAWADTRFSNGFNGTSGNDGYTVGGGLEYLFTQNWSGKIEYQYYDFGNSTAFGGALPIAGTRFTNDVHTVKAGLNYRFNLGNLGAGLVPAKY